MQDVRTESKEEGSEAMTTDRSLPAGYARCNTRDYHSKSAAYAGGFQRGWTAALARGFEEEQKSAGLAAVVEKVRDVASEPRFVNGVDREIMDILSAAPADALREHDAALIESLADHLDRRFRDIPAWTEAYREGVRTDEWMTGAVRMTTGAVGWLRERARQVREGDKK